METPTKLLLGFYDKLIEHSISEQDSAMMFIAYFKESIDLMRIYEKHIAMQAYLEGADVGRKMMRAWMQNKESDLDAFDEFKKYWQLKTTEQ